jgi:D-hexose-6-phosphate mutarotase
MQIAQLESFVASFDGVGVTCPSPDYPVLTIRNGACEGSVALHGAHVTHWQPHGVNPVIFLSAEAEYREGKALRGGIPICWPWFSSHPTDPSKPSHGFVRNRFWNLKTISETDRETEVRLELVATEETRALWPHEFHLECSIRFGQSLQIDLHATNLGKMPLTVGGALHSYFSVASLEKARVEGLDGCRFLDTAAGGEGTQGGPIIFGPRWINRIYTDVPQPTNLVDPVWKRRIEVEGVGSASTVVWNASAEQAAEFSDLSEEGRHQFVCVETANAEADVREVLPGEAHSLGCRVRVFPQD